MSKADPVIAWMLGEGRQTHHDMHAYGEALCHHIGEAGIPVARVFCGVRTLHPLVGATGYIWRRDEGIEQVSASWDETRSDAFVNSPMTITAETGEPYRRRLEGGAPLDHTVLERFRGEGMTDYLCLPMVFSDGTRNPMSFQTDAPGGFDDNDISALTRITEAMSLVVEAESRSRVARQVLDTYVGKRTGLRVLEGGIRRGFAETIRAVVWISDLRGFTATTERMPRDALLRLLDGHFEHMVGAIEEAGGEVLKFLGDGLLAIFEIEDGQPGQHACHAAMRAMEAARALTANEKTSDGTLQLPWSLALDLGEVSYGNIGGATRLDFTVIGPAVNHAARLETLAGALDEPVVISKAFAEAAGLPLRDLGTHMLKGVPDPQPVFAPATSSGE